MVHVAEQTNDAAYLTAGESSHRIRDVCIRLLDADDRNIPASTLVWILGKIHDPSLESHYKRWLHRFMLQLKTANAAIHNTLWTLDVMTDNVRSSSITEIEDNLKRAEEYTGDKLPW